MVTQVQKEKVTDQLLAKGISMRAALALQRSNGGAELRDRKFELTDASELSSITDHDLLLLYGFGVKGLAEIREHFPYLEPQ